MTSKHIHLFPIVTDEDKSLADKAKLELERDEQFLKYGDTQLLENIDLKEKDQIVNLDTNEDKVLQRELLYSKVLDVTDLNELSNIAD